MILRDYLLESNFLLGDFNVKTSWRRKVATTLEGVQVAALACSYGLNQFISSPAHILQNSSPRIDSIFTNQLYLLK